MSYGVQCEWQQEAGGRWGPCPGETIVLPEPAGLNGTCVSVSGLSPQSSYRLSVRAWNNLSGLPGAPRPATATIIVHKCTRSSFNQPRTRSAAEREASS